MNDVNERIQAETERETHVETFILCTPHKNEYKKVNPFSIECRT